MFCRERGTTWVFLRILACFFILRAVLLGGPEQTAWSQTYRLARKIAPHEEIFPNDNSFSDRRHGGLSEDLPKIAWQEPESLLERLSELTSERATAAWATETERLVNRLGYVATKGRHGIDEAAAIIGRLDKLAIEASSFASSIADRSVAKKLLRAAHALKRRLDPWRYIVRFDAAAGSITLPAHVERYEQTGLASDAKLLAKDRLALDRSPNQHARRLAGRLDAYYRNANLRIAVTEELMNRLMPDRAPQRAKVRDTILGTPVYGRSLTSTKVRMRLLPDPNRVRLALEITGDVHSRTNSNHGPATFYNSSSARYTARKPLEIDLRGIHLWPAEVDVRNNTRLRSVRTEFDAIPLVGMLAKSVARSQHDQQRLAVSREIRRKITDRAGRQIDSEADQRLGQFSQRLQQRVFDPMEALALEPTVIRAQTTPRRFIMRLRLAGEEQLGGSTPRPSAPADSLASFQVHETALNNSLEGLALNGRTFTMQELSEHVAQRLSLDEPWKVKPSNKNVAVTFARRDAVVVRCQDGRVVLTLSIARLRKSPRSWKNFQVRAFYRPQTDARSAELVRDGILHFISNRISTGSQIALRGVFSRIFSKRRPVELTPERLATDKNLSYLGVTQFVIDDGWIGIAYGPQRVARRPKLLR